MTVKDSDTDVDLFTDALVEMGDIVDDAIASAYKGKEGFVRKLKLGNLESKVIYSAWDCDGDAVPPNNLNDVPFEGTFMVVADYDSYWDSTGGNGEAYINGPVTNPTWLELAILANEAIHTTGDTHHCFFEGAQVCHPYLVGTGGSNEAQGKALTLYFGS